MVGERKDLSMRLCEGVPGKTYTVRAIQLAMQMERRLEALGLTPGGTIEVLNKKPHGAMIVKFRGSRFALGRSMTEKILIEEATAK